MKNILKRMNHHNWLLGLPIGPSYDLNNISVVFGYNYLRHLMKKNERNLCPGYTEACMGSP